MAGLLALASLVYASGLHGGFLFDDYPNIVDNDGVKPSTASIGALAKAAMSSPSSEFKRPLASLSFATNYLVSGMNPFAMKLTNLAIHLLNGLLVFLVSRAILRASLTRQHARDPSAGDLSAALIAGAWLCLPINVTAVLYVVQRMESLANLFVLAGLLGYMTVRRRMQSDRSKSLPVAMVASLVIPTTVGLLAKETAVMLPLYAILVEAALFGLRSIPSSTDRNAPERDRRVIGMFIIILVLPALAGLAWVLPGLLRPTGWSTREFTMAERLMSEARIVLDYVRWTIFPTPGALSFYHDDFVLSRGLLSPWTTLGSILGLTAMALVAWLARRRFLLITLGIALFFSSHLLTGTILPLELVYEHRNYFASMGLMLVLVPAFAQPNIFLPIGKGKFSLRLIGPALLACLYLIWSSVTAMTAYSWGDNLRLAYELAERAPHSPRAQYELGRTYIILSGYRPESPFTPLSYAPLERAASLPGSGILPEQALIFLNARLHRPIRDAWWDSIEAKLRSNKVTVQDESALASLVQCKQNGLCDLPNSRLMNAFLAALSHPRPSARLLANYGDFAWNSLRDKQLGQRMLEAAVKAKPDEPAYRITLARMAVSNGDRPLARQQRDALNTLNIGGSLTSDIASIDHLLGNH
ncbi:hypothetical protein [Luteibacter jiangsuensis]